jgi:hypothetical protein
MVRLVEMARFTDAGITIEVRSSDHGKLDKKSDPAHVHVFDGSGSIELAQIVLTKEPPQKPPDVQGYRANNPPDGLGKAIVKFANSLDKLSKKLNRPYKVTNWDAVVNQWAYFHGL